MRREREKKRIIKKKDEVKDTNRKIKMGEEKLEREEQGYRKWKMRDRMKAERRESQHRGKPKKKVTGRRGSIN